MVVKRPLLIEETFAERKVRKSRVVRINSTGHDEMKRPGWETKGLLNGLR